MIVASEVGARKAMRRRLGQYQLTFQTPAKRLPEFAGLILRGDRPVRSAQLLIVQVVFRPLENLEALLADHELPVDLARGPSLFAETPDESLALLAAALGDWMDFYFLPSPKRFLLFADHDEYTTLFAHRKAPLSRISGHLAAAGFEEVTGYVRQTDEM